MKFLADENFPKAAARRLADLGHDIIRVEGAARGIGDKDVLLMAAREDRILLTFDKDFGEIARNSLLSATCGVILFRMPMPPASEVGERLAAIIEARSDWTGNFSVVEIGRVRMRRLPAS